MASPSLCTSCLRRATLLRPRLSPSTPSSSSSFTTRTMSARHASTSTSSLSPSPLLTHTTPRRRTNNIRRIQPFTSASALRRPSPEATASSSSGSAATAPPPPQTSPNANAQTPPPGSAQQNATRPISGPGVESGASITITPRAVARLHTIAQKNSNPDSALRISVESGGCHGFQYLMSLTTLGSSKPHSQNPTMAKEAEAEEDEHEDTIFEGPQGVKVVMDEPSLELLNGSTVDYTMELIGSQFKVTGIPGASSSCGCGTSFDIK